MRTEPTTYWVCVDCYFTHHGVAETVEVDEPLSLIPETADVTSGMLASEHHNECDALDTGDECYCETQDFSWSRCDGCGSTLGGSRHALTVWETDDAWGLTSEAAGTIDHA